MEYEFGKEFEEQMASLETAGAIVLKAFQKVCKDAEERQKAKEEAYKYKAVMFDAPDGFKRRYNIGINEKPLYNLFYNGKEICPTYFFTQDGIKAMNTNDNRYAILHTYKEETYDEKIVKDCKLKSKYHLVLSDCVFDKETNDIVYEPKLGLLEHLLIFGNIVKNNATFIYLPTMKVVWDKAKYKSCKIWETETSLFVKESDWGKEPVTIINKISGITKEID